MNKILYFWELEVDPAQRDALRDAFSDIAQLNTLLKEGMSLLGVFETMIGIDGRPRVQFILELDSLAALDSPQHAHGIKEIHRRLMPFVQGSAQLTNRLLRPLAP